jgi:Transport and Golgi organisation 2
MCTISIVKHQHQRIFTFNRDEQPLRYTNEYLCELKVNEKTVYYTKDAKAGGTWFAYDSLGNVAMLFNGALVKHNKDQYTGISRGLILKTIISKSHILQEFEITNLQNVEPFTIILFEGEILFKLIWDGSEKAIEELNQDEPQFFSSVTLYSNLQHKRRKKWFLKNINYDVSAENIFRLHNTNADANEDNGLIIKRENSCHTISVSQLIFTQNNGKVLHKDITTSILYEKSTLVYESV